MSHLEALASDVPTETFLAHRAVARWLGEFFDEQTGIAAQLNAQKNLESQADVQTPAGTGGHLAPDSDFVDLDDPPRMS